MENPTEATVSRLAAMMGDWKSIELEVCHDLTNFELGFRTTIRQYTAETAAGQRRVETASVDVHTAIPHRYSSYCDGNRCADATWINKRQSTIYIKNSFSYESKTARTQRSVPFSYLYVQHRPLPEMLRKSRSVGHDRHLGRACDMFVLENVRWTYTPVDLVYCLDRETGMPLEVRCYPAMVERQQDRPEWVWKVETFSDVGGGRSWPIKSVETVFHVAADGQWKPRSERMIEVEKIRFDLDFPASHFWPALEPGATVWDQIAQKHWVVPGDPKPAVETTATVAQPIRAVEPTQWPSWIPLIVFGMGLLLLGVSLVLRRSRG